LGEVTCDAAKNCVHPCPHKVPHEPFFWQHKTRGAVGCNAVKMICSKSKQVHICKEA